MEIRLHKNRRRDKIWWVSSTDRDGGLEFTFDKTVFFNVFLDYPHNLTPQQKEIFDKENPFWANFFADRI